MNEATLIALSIVVFGWANLADWFAARSLTVPLVFTVAGLVLANSSRGIGSVDIESSTVHALANTIALTIVFSVIAHGITARPLLPGSALTVGSMHLLWLDGHHDDPIGVGERAAPG
jgi:hypothetical protein